VSYELHDQPVRFLKGKLRLRQITRLCDTGHQTQVITNRTDLRDIELAWRMFERWRQENFFKYMREEFLIAHRRPKTHPYHSQSSAALDKPVSKSEIRRRRCEYEQRRPTMWASRSPMAGSATAAQSRALLARLSPASRRSQARRSPRTQRAGRGQARHRT
jgi:hypothetical protein